MTKSNLLISTMAAGLLLSANAFAGSSQPAAGEAPFFAEPVAAIGMAQRAQVEADPAFHMLPAAGQMNEQAAAQPASTVTRADVRTQLRKAIAGDHPVAAGEANLS